MRYQHISQIFFGLLAAVFMSACSCAPKGNSAIISATTSGKLLSSTTVTSVADPRALSASSTTGSPIYQDGQPFAYNESAVDGFYDSGYEESLYSPFSFN